MVSRECGARKILGAAVFAILGAAAAHGCSSDQPDDGVGVGVGGAGAAGDASGQAGGQTTGGSAGAGADAGADAKAGTGGIGGAHAGAGGSSAHDAGAGSGGVAGSGHAGAGGTSGTAGKGQGGQAGAGAAGAAGTGKGGSTDSHGMTYFPADHVWNTPISTLPVLSTSATKIANVISLSQAKGWCGTYCDNIWVYGGNNPNEGVPINWVDSSTPHVPVAFRENGPPSGNSDWIDAPVTATSKVQTDNSDRHMIIVDTDEHKAYEFFQMVKGSGNSWTCSAEFVWDLTGYRIQPNDVLHPPYGLASVDAAGTPYIAGMIKYDEVVAGVIDHAIGGVTVLLGDEVVWPGSSRIEAHLSGAPSDGSLPAYSHRLRLKSTYDASWMTPAARTVANALKEYGILTVDRGSVGYSIMVERDSRMPDLSNLHELSLSDFEYIDESSLMISPSTAQVKP
jgi:hypothetical protein